MHTRRGRPLRPRGHGRRRPTAPSGSPTPATTGTIRATVALIALRPDGSTSVYRLTYPDGPHDAEALLLAPDGTPYIVTKEILGASGVYRPVTALVDGGTVALAKVAAVRTSPSPARRADPVGQAGQLLVTGGAVAARRAARSRCAPTPTPTCGR